MAAKAFGLWLKVMVVVGTAAGVGAEGAEVPQTPRVESVVLGPQSHASDKAVIWFDDFDEAEKPYTESQGAPDAREGFGGQGRSMHCLYAKGSRGEGNRKVFFGDSPVGKVVRRGESFDDVYWRIYVKHQTGWTGGGPAKLSRATSMVSPGWAQAMIAHVWSSGESLTLDPASGVRGDRVVTTRYNDFANLRWLGNRPASSFRLHSTEESGRWVCVESRAKLNTPGRKDGLAQLWIDGRLEAERKGLDWRGSYTGHGINAVFLEAYWNEGSPVAQSRWIDNFVISTRSIGPVECSCNPELIKTAYHGPGKLGQWEAEAAADAEGNDVVWRSTAIAKSERVRVDGTSGAFAGSLAGRAALEAGKTYYFRVRQASDARGRSPWSGWHQPVRAVQD